MPRCRKNTIHLISYLYRVAEGLHELKIDYGLAYRLYFANAGLSILLLLCGGDKRTQAADSKRAKQYWLEYKLRAAEEETEEGSER